ncbi:hypothetical protein [Rheinheimera nanhaiensis]|uniref:hypothetical protein n=1 Tax=Rheinheimera nanhaiensis TaxID=1163621 RepID=UPI00058E42EC|nr:hypothetical protein [Rheinheimera nanhaiensis]
MTEAGWTLLGVIVGALGTGFFNWLLQTRQFSHEKEMFLLQNKSSTMVKSVLNEMLNHRTYTDRSFIALKERVGGYTDDQIRQFLHEIGAKKVSRDNGTEEFWYLVTREQERSAKQQSN